MGWQKQGLVSPDSSPRTQANAPASENSKPLPMSTGPKNLRNHPALRADPSGDSAEGTEAHSPLAARSASCSLVGRRRSARRLCELDASPCTVSIPWRDAHCSSASVQNAPQGCSGSRGSRLGLNRFLSL